MSKNTYRQNARRVDRTQLMYESSEERGDIHVQQKLMKALSTENYLFSGNSGFVTNYLHELLTNFGIKPYGTTGVLTLKGNLRNIPRHVRFLYIEIELDGMGFDKQTYNIKTDVMNVLDTESKRNLIRKSFLHEKMKGSRFIAETVPLGEFTYESGVYIIRPCGMGFYSGKDIMVVSSQAEFTQAREFYSDLVQARSKHRNPARRDVNVIVSKYLDNPMLFEGCKFHLRLYLLVVAAYQNVSFKCKIARHFGELYTAAKEYMNDDFTNKEIHDTHGGSTPRTLFFPQDFPEPEILESINSQLDELELQLADVTAVMTPYPEQAKAAYEVFALDILVLETGEIKLLEVNDKVGYWPIDESEYFIKDFMQIHSQWQWEEAILPLLNATGVIF